MIENRRLAVCLAAGALALAGCASVDPETADIRAEAIEAHTAYLASDRLKGREAGAEGFDLAARYVEARFRDAGLKLLPGQRGMFLPVVLQERTIEPGSAFIEIGTAAGKRRFENGETVAIDASARQEADRIEGALVFVGYGVSAPALGHDDYKGLNVDGRIAVMLEGAPPAFSETMRAIYSGRDEKERAAAARGAVAVFTLSSPHENEFGETRPAYTWIEPDGRPHVVAEGVRATARLGPEAAAILFANAPRALSEILSEAKTGAPRGFDLGATAALSRRSNHKLLHSANVAALLPGTDRKLRREYVVLSAHLDHLGEHGPEEGDRIYNGAVDNAGGVAVMLEVARALSAGPRLKRSVIFLATTGEEKGLLGARAFVADPPAPLDAIVANVNIDGLLAFYDFSDLNARGAEHSTIAEAVAAAAGAIGAAIAPDPFPQFSLFFRSDQYAFVRRGVPSVFVLPGVAAGLDGKNGGEVWSSYMSTHYHQPSDDMSLPWDWNAARRFAEFHRLLMEGLANAPSRPQWYEGDEIAGAFDPEGRRAPIPSTP